MADKIKQKSTKITPKNNKKTPKPKVQVKSKPTPKTAMKPISKGVPNQESSLEKFMDTVSPQWAKIRKFGDNGKS